MKKYKEYFLLILFTMGTQVTIYFLLESFLTNYHLLHSFIDVPLVKYFVYFYNSWYPFIFIVTFIIYKRNRTLFKPLILTMLLSAFLAHITFIVYPTTVERPIIEVNGITDWLLDYTYKCDTPAINCFPSMHCMYCFVICYYIMKCSNIKDTSKLLIMAYSTIIVLSTLFTKQHIIEDVIGAFWYTLFSISVVGYITKLYKDGTFHILQLNKKTTFRVKNKKQRRIHS